MEEDQEDVPESAGSVMSKRGRACRQPTALEWPPLAVCGVSLQVDIRRGDDTPRYTRYNVA